MKPLSEQVKQIIVAHKEEIDDDNFDRVIADAIQCDVLEELLEAFIAVFKIKAHIHMNETTRNSQKGKHSERRVESHLE